MDEQKQRLEQELRFLKESLDADVISRDEYEKGRARIEKKINEFTHFLQNFRVSKATRVKGRVDTSFFTFIEHGPGKLWLHKGLSARESNASAGFVIEYSVSFDFRYSLFNRYVSAHLFDGTRIAYIETCAAQIAIVTVQGDTIIVTL